MTDVIDTSLQRAALEALISNNPELERLEALVADFSPFVAMGWTHQEVRHSTFLRWLLDPAETHGLGSYPLRTFLKEVLAGGGDDVIPSVFDADIWDLDQSMVLTEWESIDLLIRNDQERFVIVVENKVGSGEHSGQLQRYRKVIEARFPGYKRALFYLTPGGDPPSDNAYQSLSYASICSLVDRIIERRAGQLSPEVRTFLSQYSELVRRHIVEDSEIQALSRQIYEKHRLALDLIYEHRPDRALEVSELLQELVAGHHALKPDQSTKGYIRFSTEALDAFPRIAEGWTNTGRLVLFELENYNERVTFKLLMGPGPTDVRNFIHEQIQQNPDPFNRSHYRFYPKWWTFHGGKWLTPKLYRELPLEELRERSSQRLEEFVERELAELETALTPIARAVKERWPGIGKTE